ncbi:MAG: glycosyl hydrolase family 28-related protein [Sphingomonas sp.]
MIRIPLALAAFATLAAPAWAAPSRSAYETAPDDPRAVRVAGAGDGRADDSAALQSAIDRAAAPGGGGIVFVPAGRYRISRTLFVWPGVRVFGVGATRPVILLGDGTPGFQRGVANMVIFAGARPGELKRVPFPPPGSVPFDPNLADANPGTFYSALSNIDFAVGAGNPAAAVIRFHAAQHAYLSHIDFELGSGLAGLYQVANEAEDLHFHGGRYGILTEKPSPAWQFTLIDSSFDGQREAAIREHEAGLTLVNVSFRDVPTAIDVDPGYGDWLWGKDVRFENVARAGIVISNERGIYTQIGFENAVAANTPVFARFRDSGTSVPGRGRSYRVASFSHGLAVPGLGQMGEIATRFDAAAVPRLPAPARAIPPLPPVGAWADVRALGAAGDGKTDDTLAIQRAIDAHRVVYFPAGRYIVTDTLHLKPDTVLVALHPSLTQIVLPDRTPGYQGVGAAKPLVESARGGNAIVSGLGLSTGGINPRATALKWRAGASSLVDDVKIQGGHGTDLADGTRFIPYNANQTGDPDPAKRWDAQYPSFWVTDGGGGTFANVWSPSTYASTGFYVSDTETPGHVYQLSDEHHVRTEIGLNRVANWEFLAPQTEEEAGESGDAVSFEIRDSRNILIANYHAYRVTRSRKPAPAAVRLYGENAVRFRNVHVNAESGLGTCDENGCATFLRASKFPYENAIQDLTHGLEVREREFAALDVRPDPAPAPPAAFGGATVRKLAGGFFSASGGAVDAAGTLYFVDRWMQRIYRWSPSGLGLVRDQPLDPVNLAVDRSGNLMVLSSDGREGTVYSFKPGSPDDELAVIAPTPAADLPGARIAMPVNWWNNGEFKDQLDPATDRFTTLAEMFARDAAQPRDRFYVSPDGSLALPAFRTFQQGPPSFQGWRFSDALDAYGFVAAAPGSRLFVSNESEGRTYTARLGTRGDLTDLKPFAERGGESVATDAQGRVYVANGQIFVFAADGQPLGRIDVPERPLQLLFGGADGRTLFVLTHHALFAVDGLR